MNILFLLFAIVLIVALSFFLKKAAKGPVRSIDQLQRPMDDLLKRGFDGGILTVEHTDSVKFVQYSKYIHAKGKYGIELGFPDAEWSRKYYSDLRNYCDLHEINYSEEVRTQENDLSFLNIDCEKDTKKAYQIAQEIFIEIFKLTDTDRYHVRLQNATKDDVLVDSL